VLRIHDDWNTRESRSKGSIEVSMRVVSMHDVKLTISEDVREASQPSQLAGYHIGNAFNMVPLAP
jgi:hypothetical protein